MSKTRQNADYANTVQIGVDVGDASATLSADSDFSIQQWSTTLTAARDADLQTSGAETGNKFRLVRTAAGAFNLQVKQDGGSVLKTIAADEWSEWIFDGTNWIQIGFGSL